MAWTQNKPFVGIWLTKKKYVNKSKSYYNQEIKIVSIKHKNYILDITNM